ncbi:hypothetical protein CerSpe_270480 [Prunus speciosa]
MDEVERAGKARKHTQGPYQWAMYENWERLKQHYGDNPRELLDPLTTNNDTALNLVAFAGRKDVLEFLISLIKEAPQLHRALRMENGQGNTTLHEVAASGNLDAAMLLVRLDNRVRAELARLDLDRNGADDEACYRPVVEIRNQMGETPLYRAAAFGHTKLVKYLVSQVEDIEPHLLQIHKLSILYIAVIGHHFETALWLQKKYPFLAERKKSNGFTSLQLLAQMPSAFQGNLRKSLWNRLFYKCISNGDDTIDWVPPNQNDDLESRINRPWQSSCSKKIKRWPRMRMKSEEMQKQKALLELTHLLVEKDYSWVENKKTNDVPIFTVPSQEENAISGDDDGEEEESKSIHHNDTPLFIATSTGISQIVKKMLELHPQSVEAHDVDNQQNILHMAVKHRRLEIFKLVKKSKSVTSRMAMKIDRDGNTLLHQAAYMEYYSTNTQRVGGPALQLQQELRWMVRVQKIMPRHYTMHHNRKGMTAEELFNSEHAKLLQSAQEWMKGTAQSCSTVAALVATVVYAAAYTAPGGYDSNGLPLLRNSGFFVTFAITDTVSLISSLASLVTFLSILTSPFEYQDFYRSLPFRLHLGFTLLFFSLVTTMLTFTATIVLLIHLRKKWTTSLIYVVAFLPVPMLGLMQLPLYKGFSQGLKYILKKIRKIKFSICPARGS